MLRKEVWHIPGIAEVQPCFLYYLFLAFISRYHETIESLADRSKRPHSHPAQHTEGELKLIRDMRRRNPKLGLIDLWCSLQARGYSRCVGSLYRVLKRMGDFPEQPKKKAYIPKPY
jgi:hypothetical protein